MWFSAITDEEKEGAVSASVAATAATKLNSGDKSTTSSTTSTAPPIHYVSRRSPIYCTKACVATSQPLATSIGLHVLRGCGGNAADASVAIAAALAVVSSSQEPKQFSFLLLKSYSDKSINQSIVSHFHDVLMSCLLIA
jgi:hypothetical protein